MVEMRGTKTQAFKRRALVYHCSDPTTPTYAGEVICYTRQGLVKWRYVLEATRARSSVPTFLAPESQLRLAPVQEPATAVRHAQSAEAAARARLKTGMHYKRHASPEQYAARAKAIAASRRRNKAARLAALFTAANS